jgi:hypothetical protein
MSAHRPPTAQPLRDKNKHMHVNYIKHLMAPMLAAALTACPGARMPTLRNAATQSCGGLADTECDRAKGLLSAATSYGNVAHEFLLDSTSTLAPGRGIQKLAGGAYAPIPTECARPTAGHLTANGDAKSDGAANTEQLDFTYVGLAVDQALVAVDADLAPFLAVGAEGSTHTIRLVALAFVRDRDPQFFEGTSALSSEGNSCQCGRASHFIGSVKYGGMLAFETSVKSGEVHGKAFDLIKAKMSAKSADLRQVSTGGLEVLGLDEMLKGGASRPLKFRVNNPVPVAYAVYPITDVCRFAFPTPEVAPALVDFGELPAGKTATRLVHIQNRASIDVRALYKDQTFALAAQGSMDLPVTLRTDAEHESCEPVVAEESITFVPASKDVAAVPREHAVRLGLRAITGKASAQKRVRIDSGEARRPEYAATDRTTSCPRDYVVAGCRAESAACGDNLSCSSPLYRITAEERANGCHFACSGPNSVLSGGNFCRFDGVTDCRLRCLPGGVSNAQTPTTAAN